MNSKEGFILNEKCLSHPTKIINNRLKMAVPKKRISTAKSRIRKYIWKRKGYWTALKAFSPRGWIEAIAAKN